MSTDTVGYVVIRRQLNGRDEAVSAIFKGLDAAKDALDSWVNRWTHPIDDVESAEYVIGQIAIAAGSPQ